MDELPFLVLARLILVTVAISGTAYAQVAGSGNLQGVSDTHILGTPDLFRANGNGQPRKLADIGSWWTGGGKGLFQNEDTNWSTRAVTGGTGVEGLCAKPLRLTSGLYDHNCKGNRGSDSSLVMMAIILNWIGNSLLIPEQDKILVERGKPIYGRVVGKDAQDHQRIDYVYRVGASEYSGSGQSGGGNANFADLALDASVLVYYDPESPSVSSLQSPDYDLKSLKLLIRAGAVAIPFWPALIFFLIYSAVTRSRRSTQAAEKSASS